MLAISFNALPSPLLHSSSFLPNEEAQWSLNSYHSWYSVLTVMSLCLI